jgi:hypothetical protein
MNSKNLISGFVVTFIITLVVSVLVTFMWSFIFYGSGAVDWETSFRLAIILGVVFSIIEGRKKN